MGYLDVHPIVSAATAPLVPFTYAGVRVYGRDGDAVSSALIANGVWTFGHHRKDGAPQSLFCANGMCAKCMVRIDGSARKSCITPLREGMRIEPLDELAAPGQESRWNLDGVEAIEHREMDVLVVGAGPAGLSAAATLADAGLSVLVVDDKDRAGGKLVLQTHKFFGSREACHAGVRGVDIARLLHQDLLTRPNVTLMTSTVAAGVFSDRAVGLIRHDRTYLVAHPRLLAAATGAREKNLIGEGFDLPGVVGAGAFQTLVNRDLVGGVKRLFVVGGGNVGLIAAYHAMQAGMTVAGLCEALPHVGGYHVHADKIARMGAPLFLAHGLVAVKGKEKVEAVTIARLTRDFKPIAGTERSFPVDTVLVAVGLKPVDELTRQAKDAGLPFVTAGDAHEIAEASAAMFSGRLAALDGLRRLGLTTPPRYAEESQTWPAVMAVLAARPGAVHPMQDPPTDVQVYPRLHCLQEIPCSPCATACPHGSIVLRGSTGTIADPPCFEGTCTGCFSCVLVCPGLAISVVDRRKPDADGRVRVTLVHEFSVLPTVGAEVVATARDGAVLGTAIVRAAVRKPSMDHAALVTIMAAPEHADHIAGFRVQDPIEAAAELAEPLLPAHMPDDAVACLCERVTVGELRAAIRAGLTDPNLLKSTRAGMGTCGGGTCGDTVRRILAEEGWPCDPHAVRSRPLTYETTIGSLAGLSSKDDGEDRA